MFWEWAGYIVSVMIVVLGSYCILTGKLKTPTRTKDTDNKKDKADDEPKTG